MSVHSNPKEKRKLNSRAPGSREKGKSIQRHKFKICFLKYRWLLIFINSVHLALSFFRQVVGFCSSNLWDTYHLLWNTDQSSLCCDWSVCSHALASYRFHQRVFLSFLPSLESKLMFFHSPGTASIKVPYPCLFREFSITPVVLWLRVAGTRSNLLSLESPLLKTALQLLE